MQQTAAPVKKLTDWLEKEGYDGILLRKRQNFSWITGGKVNHIENTTEYGVADLLIIPRINKKYCFTSKMESRRIMEEELNDFDFELVECEWYESIIPLIRKHIEGKMIVGDSTFLGLEDVSSELAYLRSQLSETEITNYKWLCQKAAGALENVCHEIKRGMTEHEIAALLAQKVMEDGINPQVILVATDERIFNYRHPIPTAKKLENYAMIVICAEKFGLVANCTRFVHFGELPETLRENTQKLAKIDITMNMATKPGVRINEVFEKGLQAYAEVGFPEDWRFLHQGGLTGFAPREFLASRETDHIIVKNQAFAWNPAIRGIKSEDTIFVDEEGNQFLTHTGNWVYIEVEYDGKIYKRPDVLVR
ncbi:M24 family metallopeptidase [Evansella cellulosilytica]|uniref:M24 family metallopeptidase n=1 Tax=Evansella cellulosilytica TaxID=1413 RepID=UPI0002EDFE7D|nr:M24 family metallopeptidase [Evansella cellulosilytica]